MRYFCVNIRPKPKRQSVCRNLKKFVSSPKRKTRGLSNISRFRLEGHMHVQQVFLLARNLELRYFTGIQSNPEVEPAQQVGAPSSTGNRLAAFQRGVDILLSSPVLGVGLTITCCSALFRGDEERKLLSDQKSVSSEFVANHPLPHRLLPISHPLCCRSPCYHTQLLLLFHLQSGRGLLKLIVDNITVILLQLAHPLPPITAPPSCVRTYVRT